ncbi:hypothetical protein HZH66_003817 [Vespula vulgaris]|uniref:Uncharacterized protein n=1 Tax=Vespula vulgaris TaxID=7454 RepID=A0A834KIY3_VESVU|nr:hypothetical protein HZH66_003817 [Vespula vulgaris]
MQVASESGSFYEWIMDIRDGNVNRKGRSNEKSRNPLGYLYGGSTTPTIPDGRACGKVDYHFSYLWMVTVLLRHTTTSFMDFSLCDFRVTFGSPKTMSQITRTLLYRTTCLGHIRRITQQDQRGGSRGISISPEPLALALPINEAN